jgi:transketolase
MAEKVPGLIGGAADLVGSTKTVIDSTRLFSKTDRGARDIAFGIREHAMGTITNGIAVHGGLRPYGATFFVFSDYMRPAVRLSALMKAPSIWVYTHDSIFLGEDGPTHQPIEHLASLRAMPDLWVIRPADANEVVQAWNVALNRHDGPVALVLSRQDLPTLEPVAGGVSLGGYVRRNGDDVTLIATGSEVSAALDAAIILEKSDVSARVVSLPCWELFSLQDDEYRQEVLGTRPRISIEAASTFGWSALVGSNGTSIGLDRFGASAPDTVLDEKPLPPRLGHELVGVARHLVAGILSRHLDVSAQGEGAQPVVGLTVTHPEQARTESDRERLDPDLEELGHEEMAGFVDDDDDAQHDQGNE